MKDPYMNSKHIKPQDSAAKAPGSAKPPTGGRTPSLARASLKEIIQSAKYGEKDGIAENQAIDQILTLISQSYISKETIREAIESAYNPEITDLQLDEHHGNPQPVIYVGELRSKLLKEGK